MLILINYKVMWYSFMQRICHGYRFASSKDIFRSKRSSTKQRKSFYFIMRPRPIWAKANKSMKQVFYFLPSLKFAPGPMRTEDLQCGKRSSMRKNLQCGKKLLVREHLLYTGYLPNFPLFFHYYSMGDSLYG